MLPQALFATAIISIFPNLFLFLFPSSIFSPPKSKNGSQKRGVNWMNIFLCFAVGGLLADVFLHILPHMLNGHEHNHSENNDHGHDHIHIPAPKEMSVKNTWNSKHEDVHAHKHDHKGVHKHHEDEHDEHKHDEHEHDRKAAHKHGDVHEHDHNGVHKHHEDKLDEHEHDHSKCVHKHGDVHEHDRKAVHKHEDEHEHDHKAAHKHGDVHEHDHKAAHKHGDVLEHDQKGVHKHRDEHEHTHKHTNTFAKESAAVKSIPSEDQVCSVQGVCDKTSDEHNHSSETTFGLSKETFLELMVLFGFFIFFFTEQIVNHSIGHSHSHDHSHDDTVEGEEKKEEEKVRTFHEKIQTISATGILNLLADTMHNVTDGIAMGAGFAHGSGIGFATFLSVFFHEIPHEIADLIVLVQNGFSKWEAIGLQFVTAIGALIGTWIGYQVESNEAYKNVLLAIASGGFLYIATVSMIPSIIKEKSTVFEIIMQMISFLAGVGLMVFVLWLEAAGGHSH